MFYTPYFYGDYIFLIKSFIKKTSESWRYGSSGREPEFKPQFHKKQTNKQKTQKPNEPMSN
jgi:hypothetical protein